MATMRIRSSEINPVHGGDRLSAAQAGGLAPADLTDFSANIMPFGLSESIRQAIINSLDEVCHYPDPQQRVLRCRLAERHGLDPQQIAGGNGAADVLFRAIQVIRPGRIFLPVPTFLEYARAGREQQARIIPYRLPPEQGFAVTGAFLAWLAEAVSGSGEAAGGARSAAADSASSPAAGADQPRPDLLILCNPNNPTGLLIEPALLRRIAGFCRQRGIWLLLDECFLDFTEREADHSLMADLRQPATADRLLILRSMTKFFALPGLRLGYLCASPAVAGAVRATGQPWPVSTLAEAAGLSALQSLQQEDGPTRRARRQWLRSERERLRAALAARGWQVWPGGANFLFFHAADSPDLAERLLRQRLLIRSCANYPGLGAGYYRIAVKTPAENQLLIDALQED